MRKLLAWIAAGLLVAGCCTTLERETPIAVDVAGTQVEVAALIPPLLELEGTRIQALNGAWQDHTFVAECVMKREPEGLTVVFLTPQMRLMTLRLAPPHRISCERARALPKAFEPEYALLDLALVNLSVPQLRAALGPSFRIEEWGDVRRVVLPDGTLLAERTKLANGDIRFVQHVWGYSYTLRTVGN